MFTNLLWGTSCILLDTWKTFPIILLAPVVQTLDSGIHRINHYPADKYYGNQLRYLLDSDLSCGQRYPTFEQPGPEPNTSSYGYFKCMIEIAGSVTPPSIKDVGIIG